MTGVPSLPGDVIENVSVVQSPKDVPVLVIALASALVPVTGFANMWVLKKNKRNL